MTAGERTVLITGGTGALGQQTARRIAASDGGWHVVVTGRDGAGAERSAAAVAQRSGAPATGLPLELASLDDVRRFVADFFRHELPPLHAIVCNAGIQYISDLDARTVDGIEPTFAANHLGHFLLVRMLLPTLYPSGRIVFVSSDTHDPALRTGMPAPAYTDARSLAFPEPADPGDAAEVGRRRYTTSKLCNVLTTYELARRLTSGEPGSLQITVIAFDPGLMPGTGLARDYRGFQAFAWRYLLPALIAVPGVNAHTVGHSASALARLVTDPSLESTTAQYFSGTKPRRSSAETYDQAKAADLWAASSELTGLD
jgi:NAD(P)-dependent dehydrogenase (short-subunit alcohol dehydrogenase family)